MIHAQGEEVTWDSGSIFNPVDPPPIMEEGTVHVVITSNGNA